MLDFLQCKFKVICFSFFQLIFVIGCSSNSPSLPVNVAPKTQAIESLAKNSVMTVEDLLFSLLRNEYLYWKGTPYRLGGNSKKGIDCSALVQAVYRNSFKVNIARTTARQVKLGFFVQRNALEIADLVFFKTAWRVRHVGIYIGGNKFMHASTSKGVMISSLDNVYWNAKYWQSRRIL